MEMNERTARICPKCGCTYTARPALSRDDNKTAICPTCGTREALRGLGISEEEIEKIVSLIPKGVNDYED